MSDKNSNYLCKEIIEFINAMHSVVEISKVDSNDLDEESLHSFADKIWKLNHFSTQLLKSSDIDDAITYNARIIKDLTESPIYLKEGSKETCSLVDAADRLKRDREFSKVQMIISNLAKDDIASEVLVDNLMLIYRELAA